MTEDEISHGIYQAALEVHKSLGGPGLLESIYEEALICELEEQGLQVERQLPVPIRYKGRLLGTPLRLDLVVERSVIVECKSTIDYNPIFEAQALTYLRLTGMKLAMVINFGEMYVTRGIHRVVNKLGV